MRFPVVELSDCNFCEICADVCPDVFFASDAGYIAVADMAVYPEVCVNEAIRNCPEDCIFWNG